MFCHRVSGGVSNCKKLLHMKSKGDKGALKRAQPKDRLTTVNPSGGKEGTLTDQIYEVVKQIPPGRVTTYGTIARVLRLPNPRMVGHAMNIMDCVDKKVPAHRVVNASGKLSGEHTDVRKKMLEDEGVEVKGEKVKEFSSIFWDPEKEDIQFEMD